MSSELKFREKVTCMSLVAKSIGLEAFIEFAVRLDDSVQGLTKNNNDLIDALGKVTKECDERIKEYRTKIEELEIEKANYHDKWLNAVEELNESKDRIPIQVTDKLPGKERVLIFVTQNLQWIDGVYDELSQPPCWYPFTTDGCADIDSPRYDISHWMPLPLAPAIETN